MRSKPLEFCTHLARAVRDGVKTTTWKPLSPADQERRAAGYTSDDVPYVVGAIVPIMEAWGYVNGAVTFASTFSTGRATDPFAPPASFKPQLGARSEKSVKILSCDLVRLATITEAEAIRAGTIPPDGGTFLAEFERQWRSNYQGPLGWDANPLCWRVAFQLTKINPS